MKKGHSSLFQTPDRAGVGLIYAQPQGSSPGLTPRISVSLSHRVMAPKFSRAQSTVDRPRSRSPQVNPGSSAASTPLKLSTQASGMSTPSGVVPAGRGATDGPSVDPGNTEIKRVLPVAPKPWSYTIYRLVYPHDSQDPSYDPSLEGYISSLVNSMLCSSSNGGPSFTMEEISAAVAESLQKHEDEKAHAMNPRTFDTDDDAVSEADSEKTLILPGCDPQ